MDQTMDIPSNVEKNDLRPEVDQDVSNKQIG
jgi:hypothetical protein